MSWRQTKAGEMAELSGKKSIYESVTTKRLAIPYEKTEDYEMLIILVAYNTKYSEVETLRGCLNKLQKNIRYAVAVNKHKKGEPIEQLRENTIKWTAARENKGYGRAVNQTVREMGRLPKYLAIMNTDVEWDEGTLEKIINWMERNKETVLSVPQIENYQGEIQKLCKRDPTVLALLSRRFIPTRVKPKWLKDYDRLYTMEEKNYGDCFECQYLSGCFMIARTDSFTRVGGFDERYFLYLEDADLTREMRAIGSCVHLPMFSIRHGWGKGNYRSTKLAMVNIISAWKYFQKWGWKLW
tara:strand:- start:566 stop:1456 length:891 start_codon:yes stop_codon:yes gene_type:complete